MIFEEKYFLWFILFTDQILLPDRFYFEIFSNMFIAIICFPVCDVTNLKNYISSFIKPFCNT